MQGDGHKYSHTHSQIFSLLFRDKLSLLRSLVLIRLTHGPALDIQQERWVLESSNPKRMMAAIAKLSDGTNPRWRMASASLVDGQMRSIVRSLRVWNCCELYCNQIITLCVGKSFPKARTNDWFSSGFATALSALLGVCCNKLLAIILEIYCNISLQYQCCQYIAYCNQQLCNYNILQFESWQYIAI